MTMENKPLLQVKDLTVTFGERHNKFTAVKNVSFDIFQGETFGLVGESGSGKSVTSNSIIRLLPPQTGRIVAGEILFEDRDILKMSNKELLEFRGKEIATIFQDPMTSLNPVITVGEQIMEVIRLHDKKISKKDAYTKACEMLELVGIKADRAGDYPHQFSGGMKQRVIIAMALACNPRLLIADEPTTALDVTIQAQVLELMRKLKAKYQTSMIMITHDLGIVAEICDYVAVMYAGEIVEYGNREQLFHRPSHPYTKGLFACIPNLMEEETTLIPIEGMTPDPTNLPTGCRFHPRCPYATEECSKTNPASKEIENGHHVKCLHI